MGSKGKPIAEYFLEHNFSSDSDKDWDPPVDPTILSKDEAEIEADADHATKELDMMAKRKLLVAVSDDKEEEGVGHRVKRRRVEGKKAGKAQGFQAFPCIPLESLIL